MFDMDQAHGTLVFFKPLFQSKLRGTLEETSSDGEFPSPLSSAHGPTLTLLV